MTSGSFCCLVAMEGFPYIHVRKELPMKKRSLNLIKANHSHNKLCAELFDWYKNKYNTYFKPRSLSKSKGLRFFTVVYLQRLSVVESSVTYSLIMLHRNFLHNKLFFLCWCPSWGPCGLLGSCSWRLRRLRLRSGGLRGGSLWHASADRSVRRCLRFPCRCRTCAGRWPFKGSDFF